MMEFFVELFLDLILEGSIELSSNRKVAKWIRYPLIVLITLFFGVVIVGLFILGLYIMKENYWIGLFIVIISLILASSCIINFRKKYIDKKNNE